MLKRLGSFIPAPSKGLRRLLMATTGLFLLLAGPASALPVIGGIGALVGSIGAGGLSLGSLAIGIASMGAQWLLSMMLAPDVKQRGIKTRMETGGDNPPSVIVGEYATAGQLIYANTLDGGTNIPESCLVYVICLSALPITAVSNEVFINGERCTIDTSETFPGGFYAIEEYVKGTGDGGYCSMKFHLGDQDSADSWMMDKFGSDPDRPWDEDMFLPGCAYAIVRCWYSNRGIWTGLPEFRFQVQGVPLYDPRKDSSVGGSGSHRWNNQNTWEYSRNAKVIEYNVHRGFWWDDKHQWGGRAEAYRLPLDYWFAAMNACDEDVPKRGGGTVKRYRVGAEIGFDDKPIDVINEINKSCSGYTTEFGGTYKTWVGGPGLSVGTITDDDFAISADMETTLFQPRQMTFNTCYASFPAPQQQWEVKDAPRYQDADAFEADGEELALDLPLPFVSESSQVQRLARLAIRDSRRQVTHGGQLPPIAWVYEPFDRLNYVSTRFGYGEDGKDFIVASKDDLPNVMQQTLLREWNPGDAGWLVEYEQETDFAPLVIVGATDLELDVDVFADEIEAPGGKDKPAIRAEWSWGNGDEGPGEIDVRYIDWRIRRNGATKIIARGKLEAVEDGEGIVSSGVLRWGKDYEIQFRAVPFGIRGSAWTDWKDVSMTAVEVPTGLTLTQQSKLGDDGKLDFFVLAVWDDADQDNNGYGVKITIDGVSDYKKTDGSRYKFAVKAPETVTVEVRTRGSEGSPSAYCDPEVINVTKKIAAPTTPTELTVVGKHRRAVVKTEDHPDKDFRRWNVYYSKTNNFGTATKSEHSRSRRFVVDDLDNGDTYYFWLTAEDTSGNESAKFPSSNTAGVSALIVKLDDDDTEGGTLAAPTLTAPVKVQDTDEDGKVQTYIKLDCTAPGWATSKTTYVYSIEVGSDTYTVKSDDTKASFRVQKTGAAHVIKVRGVKGHGNKGSWSATQSITPTKKATGPTPVSGFQVKSKPAGNRLKWDPCLDSDYAETILYRNTVNNFATATEIGRIKGNRYLDQDDNLIEGTNYKYWADHVNTSAVAASAPATDDDDFKLVTEDDIETITLSAPTMATPTQANRDIDLDGTVDIAWLLSISSGVAGAANYEFELSRSTSSGGSYTVIQTVTSPTGKAWVKANTQYFYKARARAIAWNGMPGTWTALSSAVQPAGTAGAPANPSSVTVTPSQAGVFLFWAAPTELDYDHTEIAIRTTVGTPSSTDLIASSVSPRNYVFLPAMGTAYYVYVRHYNTSGLPSANWVVASGSPVTAAPISSIGAGAVDTPELANDSVTRAKLDAGAAGAVALNNLGSSIGSVNAGAATMTFLSLTFVVSAGGGAGMNVTLGGKSWTGITINNNEPYTFTTTEMGGGSFSFTRGGGFTFSGAQLSAVGVH